MHLSFWAASARQLPPCSAVHHDCTAGKKEVSIPTFIPRFGGTPIGETLTLCVWCMYIYKVIMHRASLDSLS